MMTTLFYISTTCLLGFLSIYYGKIVYQIYYFWKQRKSKDVVFLSVKLKSSNLLWGAVLSSCMQILIVIGLWIYALDELFLTYIALIIISCVFQILHKPSHFEAGLISQNNSLNLGAGCANWYYENYLKKFVLPSLLTRIKEFKARQQVTLPHKLYILCPHSCIVQKYIDNVDNIERCRELPTVTDDYSGVREREYNITVYQILHLNDTFRCAIEYAQPLKSLLHFKNFGKMTLQEMFIERDMFCRKLNELLRDENDSYKYCELIQFDDKETTIHEVLYGTNSIKEYINLAYI